MARTFQFKKVIVLVAILALPGFLYYMLKEKGKNRYHPLEVFGPKKLSGTFHSKRGKQIPDTLYHTIGLHPLTGPNGAPIYLLKDTFSIKVVCFYFAGSSSERYVNGAMRQIAEEFGANPRMRFYSITGKPNGQPEDPGFSRTYRADPRKWLFLTTGYSQVQQMARADYLVDALADSTTDWKYKVSPMLILLDPASRIRGYYDTSVGTQIARLKDEIKVLIAEEVRKERERQLTP